MHFQLRIDRETEEGRVLYVLFVNFVGDRSHVEKKGGAEHGAGRDGVCNSGGMR